MAHRNLMLLCLLQLASASWGSAQGPSDAQLCQSIRLLLQASYSDFNQVKRNITRHSDGTTDWVPSITVAGSQDCEGQSDPQMASSVSCTMIESQSAEEVATAYQNIVRGIRSCLDSSFIYAEKQGGKSTRLSTPIKEASFEVKGKGDSPDGPAVRVSMEQFHRTTRSGYELTIWIDGIDKE
jgi:hypothetical protein